MNEKIVSVLKFLCLVYLIFIIPKTVSFFGSVYKRIPERNLRVLLGVENLVYNWQKYKDLKNYRIGFIGDKFSFDQLGNKSVDLLKKNRFAIDKIFILDLEKEWNQIDCFLKSNIKKIDCLMIDIQDPGIFSANISNFFKKVLDFSSRYKKKIVVLDRPNFLGRVIEGPGDIPWRHGLTIGELAYFFNKNVVKRSADLLVVPLKKWKRTRKLSIFSFNRNKLLSFLNPMSKISPISIVDSSKGVGNRLLFFDKNKLSRWEIRYLKRICWRLGLHCVDSGIKSDSIDSHTIKLSLKNDINNFSSFNSLLTISRFLKNRKQIKLSFEKDFDKLVGSDDVRRFLQGDIKFKTLKKNVEKSTKSFYDKSRNCCLYAPLPMVGNPEIVKV